MTHSVVQMTQSKYYSPVFNAAVFDGPLRVYFAQHQEPIALKIYVLLQQFLNENFAFFRKNLRENGRTIFVMLYPNPELFALKFPEAQELKISVGHLSDDFVIGLTGPVSDENLNSICAEVTSILKELPLDSLEYPAQLEEIDENLVPLI